MLIYGDNLIALKTLIEKYNLRNKVDLIYIDPPFATKRAYTLSKNKTSTISHSKDDEVAFTDFLQGEEFIEFIRERLILAKELLSEKGSIYLHIDYKIGHYIKIIMDEIFDLKNFRNDITRIKCNPKNFNYKRYGNIKDLILFYSKTDDFIWNTPKIEYSEEYKNSFFKKIDRDGRAYTTVSLNAPGEVKNGVTGEAFKGVMPPKGRHWSKSPKELEKLDEQGLIEWSKNNVPRLIVYADEKNWRKMQDIWDFKDHPHPIYPTEKNFDMLKSIINTSSNEDSLIMDFFCGSGSTLKAASDLNRKWIGIDKSDKAIEVTKSRFNESEYQYLEVNV